MACSLSSHDVLCDGNAVMRGDKATPHWILAGLTCLCPCGKMCHLCKAPGILVNPVYVVMRKRKLCVDKQGDSNASTEVLV